MRIRLLFLVIIGIGIAIASLGLRAKAAPTIIINELMWMGSSASTADEWIELRNPSDQPVDVSGWQLTKYSNNQDVAMLTIPTGSVIAAHGFFVISNYAPGAHSILQNAPQVVNTDVALANTNLRIQLIDGAGNVIDVAGDGKGTPFTGEYVSAQKIYASMERNPEPGDGTSASSWHSATRAIGFLPNVTELGTPGAENSNGQPQISLDASISGNAGVPVHLDASDTTDPENDPLTFSWLIDGQTTFNGPVIGPSLAAGDHPGVLTVQDGSNVATKQFVIHVVATTTTAVTPTVAGAATSSCSGLMIDEVFPDPKGADTNEFLEIANPTAQDISLAGCHLLINTAHEYALPDQVVLAHHQRTLDHQKWKLINSGMTVSLIDGDGTILNTATYPKAKEGWSWSSVGSEWGWAKPTPNAKNAALESLAEASTSSGGTTTSKKTATPVEVHGVVIAQTGLLGAQLAVVATSDEDEVVKTDKEVLLSVGQRVDAEGVAGTRLGEAIVLVHGKVTGQQATAVDGQPASLGDLDWPDQYRLVTISGTVQSLKGSTIVLEDDSGDGQVALKTISKIIRPAMQAGDHLTVTGIVSVATTGVKILPRQPRDLVVTPKQLTSTTQPTVAATTAISPWWYWSAAGLGLGVIGLLQWRKNRANGNPA